MNKSKKIWIIRAILFVGTIVSLFFVPWLLVLAWIKPLPDRIDDIANEAVSRGFDGIILYVDDGDAIPAFYGAGWHDRIDEIPANPHALFKIASISKLYTAVAVTKLVGVQMLSLDKSLADYLPELKGRIENAELITLRMMIQHRSGIPNYTDTDRYWETVIDSYEENLGLILNTPASFLPNESYEYSNTNYLLLSKIMDDVLGYNHFQYIQEEILNRFGLQNTFESIKGVNLDNVMSGYHVGYPLDLKTNNQGMVASAEDVGIFLRALNDGSLFDEGENELYASLYENEHKGWVPGYQSIAKYEAELDTVIVQFTSTTDPKLLNWNLADIIYGRVVKVLKNGR